MGKAIVERQCDYIKNTCQKSKLPHASTFPSTQVSNALVRAQNT